MKNLLTFAAIALFATGALTLMGCQSANPTTAPSDQNAYAGGTGVFGEDPGEHPRDRFMNSGQFHPAPETSDQGR